MHRLGGYDCQSGLEEESCAGSTSLVAVALLALVAAAGWMHGQPEAAATLTAEDRAEITQLYATMYQGSDFRDADLWLSAFAEDAVFVFPTGDQLEGHDALLAWRQRSFGGRTGDSKRRHHVPNIRIVPTARRRRDRARAYWIELDVAASPSSIKNTGTADDVFVEDGTPAGSFRHHAVHLDVPIN